MFAATKKKRGNNTVKKLTIEQLRQMEGQEGLVLQGCGGDLQEWVDGINELLTEAGILLDGSRFENVAVFQHEGLTNLLFPLEGAKLATGKLIKWRLQTHNQFGGTWLADFRNDTLDSLQRRESHCHACQAEQKTGRGLSVSIRRGEGQQHFLG